MEHHAAQLEHEAGEKDGYPTPGTTAACGWTVAPPVPLARMATGFRAEEKTYQAKLNATLHTRRRGVNVNYVEPAVLTGLLDALDGFECHQNISPAGCRKPREWRQGHN